MLENPIERTETERLVKLSSLCLSDDQIQSLTKDLQGLIAFADQINRPVCGSCENGCCVIPEKTPTIETVTATPFREDEVVDSYSSDVFLQGSKTSGDGYYILPGRSM